MEMPCNIPLLSREQQLEKLLEEARRDAERKGRVIRKLRERIGRQTTEDVEREIEQENRMEELEAENQKLEAENRELRGKLAVAMARLEERRQAQPMTIIYGNNATPMYGERIINKQNNSTNHKSKNEMNNPTINNYGGNNQVGDGNTMHVHSAQQQETLLTPTQEKAREALITLSTEGRWEKQQWWAVWKVLMALHLVNKNAREFADYLVDLGVTPDNVYDSIRKLDAEFRNISTINATEWQQYNGKYGDKYQKQIDTASRLLTLLGG